MRTDTRRAALGAAVVLLIASAFLLGYSLCAALLLLSSALLLATALDPLVVRAQQLGLSRASAAALVHLALLGGLLLALIFLVPLAAAQVRGLTAKLPDLAVALQARLAGSSNAVLHHLSTRLPPPASSTASVTDPAALLSRALTVAQSLALGAFHVLAVLAVSHAWSVEGDAAVRATTLLLPPERREQARELWGEARGKVGGYVRGQLLVCASSALVSGLAYFLIGLPDALALGLATGAGECVPLFGPILGATPALLVAFSVSPALVPWVALLALCNHLGQSYVVLPRVMGRAVGVSPLVVLLSVSALGSLAGALGAILAIPLAAVLQLLVDRLLVERQLPDDEVSGRDRASRLPAARPGPRARRPAHPARAVGPDHAGARDGGGGRGHRRRPRAPPRQRRARWWREIAGPTHRRGAHGGGAGAAPVEDARRRADAGPGRAHRLVARAAHRRRDPAVRAALARRQPRLPRRRPAPRWHRRAGAGAAPRRAAPPRRGDAARLRRAARRAGRRRPRRSCRRRSKGRSTASHARCSTPRPGRSRAPSTSVWR